MSDTPDKWYLSGPLGIDVPEPPQQLSLTGGIGFANHNAKDKKLYSPADGVLEWMTHDWAGQHGFAVSHQGTQRVFLNTNGNSYLNGGNVGIGTTEPKATLHINGELRIDGARTIINGFDGANNHWIKTNTAEPASVFMTFVNTSGGDAQAVRIAPGNKGGLTVNSAGNVGIGTTEPNRAKLEVSGMEGVGNTVALFGRGAQGVSLVANGPTVGFNTYYDGVWKSISAGWTGVISNDQGNGDIDFIIGSKAANPDEAVTMATTPLSLTREGKVGIGTRGPQAKLHVNGDTFISGNTTVGGSVTTSQLNVQGDIQCGRLDVSGTFAVVGAKNEADGRYILDSLPNYSVIISVESILQGTALVFYWKDGNGNKHKAWDQGLPL